MRDVMRFRKVRVRAARVRGCGWVWVGGGVAEVGFWKDTDSRRAIAPPTLCGSRVLERRIGDKVLLLLRELCAERGVSAVDRGVGPDLDNLDDLDDFDDFDDLDDFDDFGFDLKRSVLLVDFHLKCSGASCSTQVIKWKWMKTSE
jgi:hypothetical protein